MNGSRKGKAAIDLGHGVPFYAIVSFIIPIGGIIAYLPRYGRSGALSRGAGRDLNGARTAKIKGAGRDCAGNRQIAGDSLVAIDRGPGTSDRNNNTATCVKINLACCLEANTGGGVGARGKCW